MANIENDGYRNICHLVKRLVRVVTTFVQKKKQCRIGDTAINELLFLQHFQKSVRNFMCACTMFTASVCGLLKRNNHFKTLSNALMGYLPSFTCIFAISVESLQFSPNIIHLCMSISCEIFSLEVNF